MIWILITIGCSIIGIKSILNGKESNKYAAIINGIRCGMIGLCISCLLFILCSIVIRTDSKYYIEETETYQLHQLKSNDWYQIESQPHLLDAHNQTLLLNVYDQTNTYSLESYSLSDIELRFGETTKRPYIEVFKSKFQTPTWMKTLLFISNKNLFLKNDQVTQIIIYQK